MQQFEQNGRIFTWNPENPSITCLMSVYNGEEFLKESIDSILAQSFTDFEFLIVNDGSTDNSVSIIESYDDPRIRLVQNDENIGLTKSLNKGIDLAKGEYIARMDADDISMPERFEKQVGILDNNNSVNLVADKQHYTFGIERIINDDEIDVELLFHNCIAHSSVLFRRTVGNKTVYYNPDFLKTQDYDLWTSPLFRNTIKFCGDSLVFIRNHNNRISAKSGKEQNDFVMKVHEKLTRELGLQLGEDQLKVYKRASDVNPGNSQYFIVTIVSLFKLLLESNKGKGIYNHEYLHERIQSLILKYLKTLNLNIYSYLYLSANFIRNIIYK